MVWFNFITQRSKVLTSGKTLKSPDKRLISGLNLNPKVRKTNHIIDGVPFHSEENKSAQFFRLLVCEGPEAHKTFRLEHLNSSKCKAESIKIK